MTKTCFIDGGNWYKGNLHCHTVASDGRLTAPALKTVYQKLDYDFMVYSDHNIHTYHEDLSDENFLVIQGLEGDISGGNGDNRVFHLLFMDGTDEIKKNATKPMYKHMETVPNKMKFEGLSTVQAYIDDMVSRGYMVMFNHPAWSCVEYDDILQLKNLFAVECINASTQHIENIGENFGTWDALLRQGMKIWGTATDDNHNTNPVDSVYSDAGLGFVVVKCKELTRSSVADALYRGSFYSSCGPKIYDFRVEDNEVIFECSPVSRIYFRGKTRESGVLLSEDGKDSLTHFRMKLCSGQEFVRVECYDATGRKAFTNPIYLGEDK